MSTLFNILLIAYLASPVVVDKTENQIRYEKAAEKEKILELANIDRRLKLIDDKIKELREAKKGGREKTFDPYSNQTIPEAIRELRKERTDLNKRSRLIRKDRISVEPKIHLDNLDLGMVGKIEPFNKDAEVRVFEIKDTNRVVFEVIDFEPILRRTERGMDFKVEKIGEREVRVFFFALEGVDTSKMSEGKVVDLPNEYFVTSRIRFTYFDRSRGETKVSIAKLVPFLRDW